MCYARHIQRKVFYGVRGLESLKSRRWFKRLCCMFKIMKIQAAPEHLHNLILIRKQNFNSVNIYIPSYNCRSEYSKSSFFPVSLDKWFHLDLRLPSHSTKTIAFISSVRKQCFQHFWPRRIEFTYLFTSWL